MEPQKHKAIVLVSGTYDFDEIEPKVEVNLGVIGLKIKEKIAGILF